MSGKSGAAERFAEDPAFAVCRERLPEIAEQHPSISKSVAQAAKTGFPGDNLARKPPIGTRDSPVPRGGGPQQVV